MLKSDLVVARLVGIVAFMLFGSGVLAQVEISPQRFQNSQLNENQFSASSRQEISGPGPSSTTKKTSDLRVTVLGSGTPRPSARQFGAAILVQAGGKNLLIDCGRGCTSRLSQVNQKLVSQVDLLFVTHLHSDHVMGIDDLLLNGWALGRETPLRTWGPTGTKHMMLGIIDAFKTDIKIRLKKGVPSSSSGLADAFTEIGAGGGVLFSEDGLVVSAFEVDHGYVKPAFGFKIEYGRRKVVISGDTTLTPALYEQGKDADLMLLEVLAPELLRFAEKMMSKEQAETIKSLHMTVEQAAEVMNKANPRLGVYYHTANEPSSVDLLLAETKKHYGGRVMVGHDLMSIEVADEIKVKTLSAGH